MFIVLSLGVDVWVMELKKITSSFPFKPPNLSLLFLYPLERVPSPSRTLHNLVITEVFFHLPSLEWKKLWGWRESFTDCSLKYCNHPDKGLTHHRPGQWKKINERTNEL